MNFKEPIKHNRGGLDTISIIKRATGRRTGLSLSKALLLEVGKLENMAFSMTPNKVVGVFNVPDDIPSYNIIKPGTSYNISNTELLDHISATLELDDDASKLSIERIEDYNGLYTIEISKNN